MSTLKPPAPNLVFENVKSSNIQGLAYCPVTKTLGVRFASGGLFHYANVPHDKFKALREAKSIGSHFAKHVRPVYNVVALPK